MESQTTITGVRGELAESHTTIDGLREEIRNRSDGPEDMGRRIGELEEEMRRAQTTITQIRNEIHESRKFENAMHKANDGFRRSMLNLEQQAVGAPIY